MYIGLKEELELLSVLKGQRYKSRRDALLSREGDLKSDLTEIQESDDWMVNTLKVIMLGWLSHNALYRSVLNEYESIDVPTRMKSAGGISARTHLITIKAAKEYKTRILPFCWEILLKFDEEWPVWKTASAIDMMAAVPHEKSIPVFIYFLNHCSNEELVSFAEDRMSYLKDSLGKKLVEELDLEMKRLETSRDRLESVKINILESE